MFDVADILDLAIRMEENGEAVYRSAIPSAPNPDIAAALEWMAGEEAVHRQWFIELKATAEQAPDHPVMKAVKREALFDILGEDCFSLEATDVSTFGELSELVAAAMGFEQDSVLFYEMLAPFLLKDSARRQLDGIIAEERRHMETLEAFSKQLLVPAG